MGRKEKDRIGKEREEKDGRIEGKGREGKDKIGKKRGGKDGRIEGRIYIDE